VKHAIQVLIRGWLVIGMAATVIFFPGLAANIMIGVFMILSWLGAEMSAFNATAANDVVSEHDHTILRLVALARMQR
jgi:hypothetical protein